METVERIGRTSRNIPSGKAPKALKTVKRSVWIHFVISRSCVRVTPPAPKSIENFGFRCFFVAKTLKMVWVKMRVNCLTHTVTHTRNKLYPRKWTRDFDPWPRSADTHLTHRVSQWLCRLLPAHAPWVQRNVRKEPKSTGEETFAFSPVFLRLFSAYMTCAMKLPIVCAASSCFCLVAWV